MNARTCLCLATLLGFCGVLLGAFGAHGLSDTGRLEEQYADMDSKNVSGMMLPASYKYFQDFRTGVRYHMWHALALLGIGVWKKHNHTRSLSVAAWCFVLGILLFSGALYVLVIAGPKFGGITWGLIAPVGGTSLLIGWVAMLVAAVQEPAGL